MSTEKERVQGIMIFDATHVIALSSNEPLTAEQIHNIDWAYEICTAKFPLPYKEVKDKEVHTYVKLQYLRDILKTADDLGIKNDYGQVKLTTAPNSFIKISWGKDAVYVAPIEQKKQEEYDSEVQISDTEHTSTDSK